MGGKKVLRYPIIIEKSKNNYSAYSPDLPGCVATGATIKETLSRMRSAIKLHLEGLTKEGSEILEPSTKVKYVEITF
jgi:predicted RNase H-like HicB family nuclease